MLTLPTHLETVSIPPNTFRQSLRAATGQLYRFHKSRPLVQANLPGSVLGIRSFTASAESLNATKMTTQAPAGTRYSISVLTTHTVDSAPALLVAFDSQRYLFNTPEAISRIALQNKVGLRKVGHVFLGDVEESAGLPGFILSSVEAGNERIKLVGPEGTDHFLATCRFFTRR